ncbi:MAG TPA: hypothetical protein VMF33_07330, partial [Acidimicrobiales bacterium]|nr:hypothetical protein [Acidimicrobiales bacterium]
MDADATFVSLPGSVPPPHDAATRVGALDPSSQVDVTLYLRPRTDHPNSVVASRAAGGYLSRSDLAAERGASSLDLTALEDFARSHALDVVEVDPAGR